MVCVLSNRRNKSHSNKRKDLSLNADSEQYVIENDKGMEPNMDSFTLHDTTF